MPGYDLICSELSNSGGVSSNVMPSSAVERGDMTVEESSRMTNKSDEWRPDQYPNTAIFPLGLDCSLQRRLLTSMERRSYVMATMRLTVIALVICSVTIPLSSSTASKSFTYDLIKSIDHDPQAFTQGLEIDEGMMYELSLIHI